MTTATFVGTTDNTSSPLDVDVRCGSTLMSLHHPRLDPSPLLPLPAPACLAEVRVRLKPGQSSEQDAGFTALVSTLDCSKRAEVVATFRANNSLLSDDSELHCRNSISHPSSGQSSGPPGLPLSRLSRETGAMNVSAAFAPCTHLDSPSDADYKLAAAALTALRTSRTAPESNARLPVSQCSLMPPPPRRSLPSIVSSRSPTSQPSHDRLRSPTRTLISPPHHKTYSHRPGSIASPAEDSVQHLVLPHSLLPPLPLRNYPLEGDPFNLGIFKSQASRLDGESCSLTISPVFASCSSSHGKRRSSPSSTLRQCHGKLPPLQLGKPLFKAHSGHRNLPPLRLQLADIWKLSQRPRSSDHDYVSSHYTKAGSLSASSFLHSPSGNVSSRRPTLGLKGHNGCPISPNSSHRDDRSSSAASLTDESTDHWFLPTPSDRYHIRASTEDSCSPTGTPKSERSDRSDHSPTSTLPTAASSSAGTPVSPSDPNVGPVFVCQFAGCRAPPFHTQYLLNSHATVHSSERPHYCLVADCSRGPGGKGFKRKNEMTRHGLVHDSPGYLCPYCYPKRVHRYPRPDNLQRHVRVHHPTIDKDDPSLRRALSLRRDGRRRKLSGPTS